VKTPNLIDVPKDSPTRKERIEAFKKQHGIQTHDGGYPGEDRWLATLFDDAWKRYSGYCKEKTLFGLMEGACRLVEEAGLCSTARSEITAVRELCRMNKISCPI